ncbi:sensor histidine kinase [Hymenobacter sp. DG25A]|uniref:sensor histidine kinase n=1 Tax=Hymenobacter sp. DG25A TaxID=1385663 RepID=UPI0006BCD950|nr:histidine kinase [Hymenobacter sp. DG25A]ALD20453.1 hypothetical protein AM218_03515 [Hymenobacter sp. DG25A]
MNDRRFLLLGIPILSILVMLPRGLLHISSLTQFLIAWPISMGFTACFWLTGRALWRYLFRRYPRVEQTRKRLWLLAIINTLITAVVTLVLGSIEAHSHGGQLSIPTFFFEFGLNMVPTVVVQLIYESWNFFRQWEENVRRAEQLQSASQRAQLEALQQQLDPHFLFNSLNTLSAFIEPENEPAQQFVEQLADVYRYVLLSREQSTVPLRDELAFVEAYVALQKARLRDNLQVEIQVPPTLLDQHVAPLSVQLLLENALKHNEASRQYPLQVEVSAHDGWLVVHNVRRPRTTLAPGTGMGLRNIRERYALLAPQLPVQVLDTATDFTVHLPLLPATANAHSLAGTA